jgi:hypothetical protein
MKERCRNCRFSLRGEAEITITGIPDRTYICRLEPPEDGYRYPVVDRDCWCSHYQPRWSILQEEYARGHADGVADGLILAAEGGEK